MKRRVFLRDASQVSLGFLGLSYFATGCKSDPAMGEPVALAEGYGPLLSDPEGIMNLPEGFSYRIISRLGETMTDGLLVPGAADGMATFEGRDGKVIIIRNHELSPTSSSGPFGASNELLGNVTQDQLYDYGHGTMPCQGGTTTMVYNPGTGLVETQYLSLAGTIRNCAGGPTPWGSWITCEEDTTSGRSEIEKEHGYNFEVPASATPQLFTPNPLKDMGRFNHEAVCVDPRSGIVYQTEDRQDSLIYRFLPNQPGRLEMGGKLQVLGLKDMASFDTRNWKNLDSDKMEPKKSYQARWIDIDDVSSPEDDLRLRGFELGGARFARGEGMWFGENEIYFACTSGGHKGFGQIFKYIPSEEEGGEGERDNPGTLELFIEPNDTDLIQSADNLTIGKNGHLVICEDLKTPRIVGVSPAGEIYHIAKNVGFQSEFAGACFSPNGEELFVNIQGPGLTLAIEGPWGKLA